jgi:hypothetical protein
MPFAIRATVSGDCVVGLFVAELEIVVVVSRFNVLGRLDIARWAATSPAPAALATFFVTFLVRARSFGPLATAGTCRFGTPLRTLIRVHVVAEFGFAKRATSSAGTRFIDRRVFGIFKVDIVRTR